MSSRTARQRRCGTHGCKRAGRPLVSRETRSPGMTDQVPAGYHPLSVGQRALAEEPTFLKNLWYMAGLSSSLKPGALRREMLLGEPVLLARTPDGRAFALRDICPHRAAPLSAGKFRDSDVECPYHGWR